MLFQLAAQRSRKYPNDKPYWNYEDIGIFFLVLVLIGFVLRLLVRIHLLSRSELNNPCVFLQVLLIASLTLALYLVLKLHHRRSVLRSLGWVWPRPGNVIVSLIGGELLASGVALYLRYCHRSTPQIGLMELLFLGVSLGPILEESFFRGCLLPLLAQTTGNVVAVILTAFLFALLHQPSDLAHWVSFTATGVAYGWIRVSSRSTIAAALMHAMYNSVLCLSAAFRFT
jgi:membrane protease YdiL (CAAX protease family)